MALLKWSTGRKSVAAVDVDPGQISYRRKIQRMFALLGHIKDLTVSGGSTGNIDHSGAGKGCLPGYTAQMFEPTSRAHEINQAWESDEPILSHFRLFHLARGETSVSVSIQASGSVSSTTTVQIRRLSDFSVVAQAALGVTESGQDVTLNRFSGIKLKADPGETYVFCLSSTSFSYDYFKNISIFHNRYGGERAHTSGDISQPFGPETSVPFNNGASGAKTAKMIGMHDGSVVDGTPFSSWHAATAAGTIAALTERLTGAPAMKNPAYTLFSSGGTVEGNEDPVADPFQSGAQKTEVNEPLCDVLISSVGWGNVRESDGVVVDTNAQPPGLTGLTERFLFFRHPIAAPDLETNNGRLRVVIFISSQDADVFLDKTEALLEVQIRNDIGTQIDAQTTSTWTQSGSSNFGWAELDVFGPRDARGAMRIRIDPTAITSQQWTMRVLSVMVHQPQD